MTNQEDNRNTVRQLFVFLAVFVLFGVVPGLVDQRVFEFYKTKHDNFEPMKGLLPQQDSSVYAIGDSVLNIRKARYDALVADYKYALDKMEYRPYSVCSKFEKYNIHTKYADEIGAKTVRQYSRYLDGFENDSLGPAYRNVYYRNVLGMKK